MFGFLAQMQPQNVFTPQWWKGEGYPRYGYEILPPMWAVTLAAIFTIGLYTLLYRENRFYRLVEHIFVGLAAGFSVYQIWAEVIYPQWWEPMVGKAPVDGMSMVVAHWAWAGLLPIGFLAFFVFSKNNAWLSRIPIGIIIGLWSGQQLNAFFNRYLPQIANTGRAFFPNKMGLVDRADPVGTLAASQAVNNFIIVITFIVVLSYFLYSFEQKNKLVQRSSLAGRWLLMVGFGVIFGTTMMTRFVLFIDRAYFVLVEWLKVGPPN